MTCQGCYYFERITLSYLLLPYLKDNTSQLLTMIVFWVVEEVIAKGGTFKVRVRTLQPVKDLPGLLFTKLHSLTLKAPPFLIPSSPI
jgi:hypothetical protein